MSYFVEKREGKRGITYRVQVIIKQDGPIIHREQRSFPAYRDANSWGAQRDKAPQKAVEDAQVWTEVTNKKPSQTIGELDS